MNDNGDEAMDADITAIVNGVEAVMGILHKTEDGHIALQILAASASCMLCSMVVREEEAKQEFEMFIEAIRRSVDLSKRNKMTVWIEGSAH